MHEFRKSRKMRAVHLIRKCAAALPPNIAELRSAFAAAFHPKLLDAAAQGAGIKFQNCRGAVGTLDAPVGLFEDLEDAFFLGLSERTISRSPRDIDFGARTGLEGIGGRC